MTAVAAAVAAGFAVALWIPGPSGPAIRGWPFLLVPAVLFVPAPLVGSTCVLAAGGCGAHLLLRRRRQRATRDASVAAVRDHCEVLAAELAAGAQPAVALARLTAAWPAAARVVEADRWGLDVAAVWRAMAAQERLPSLELVAFAWSYAARTGVGLGAAMTYVAEQLRDRARVDRTVAEELSSARATAWLVALLPVGVLVVGSGLGGHPWQFLFLTTPGMVLLAVGMALIWLGLWWLEVIIDRARL